MAWYIRIAEIDGEIRLQGRPEYYNPEVDSLDCSDKSIRRFVSEKSMEAYFVEHGIMTRRMYDKQHQVCPNCGSPSFSSTYAGYIAVVDRYQNFKDENCVKCSCGFEGIVHDLVPKGH